MILMCCSVQLHCQYSVNGRLTGNSNKDNSVHNILKTDYLLTIGSGLLNHFKMFTVHQCV